MMKFGMLTSLFSLVVAFSFGQAEDASRRRNFSHENEVALREFDPVSYFQNNPVKGQSKFAHRHKGITYYFSSEQNREEFKKAPQKYEPAYGGWCAYTLAHRAVREKSNPSTYKIVDGKLYLFSNFNGKNTLLLWNPEEKKLKAAADKNWIKTMH